MKSTNSEKLPASSLALEALSVCVCECECSSIVTVCARSAFETLASRVSSGSACRHHRVVVGAVVLSVALDCLSEIRNQE